MGMTEGEGDVESVPVPEAAVEADVHGEALGQGVVDGDEEVHGEALGEEVPLVDLRLECVVDGQCVELLEPDWHADMVGDREALAERAPELE